MDRYELILAADCTFSEALNPPLIATVDRLLERAGGILLLALASRTSLLIPQVVQLCEAKGLRLVEPRLDEQQRPITHAPPDPRGWIFRFER